ncbi:hypothetical protein C5167_035125 [Papaver somniferum]|uniref:Pru domain-containing protein n=1 Tax=Papaver somniferum TaxID=3469 RepID=A0A4Y7KIG1_PAPSO|nr:hypothetical protein C5167_035125 [Papaver somniferum]
MDQIPPNAPDSYIPDVMLEFRAGKLNLEGTRLVADSRKGLVRIARGDEGLLHFQWLDRTQNVLEDDQIIFPDEAVFEKVGPPSERVYRLKFSTDNRTFFFWMQEPNSDEDSRISTSVNFHMNRPFEFDREEPEISAPLPLSEASDKSEDMAEDEVSSRANLVMPNFGTTATSDVSSSAGPVKMADLQRILSSFGAGDAALDPDGGLGLEDILTPELILPLIESLPLEQRLAAHLPEGKLSPSDLIELLQCPQFRQQVLVSKEVHSGLTLLLCFGIDPAKYNFSVQSFLEALDDSVAKVSDSGETGSRQDDNKDSTSQAQNDPMDEGH